MHGKTMFIIEAKYGVAGYAAWFKLLELLCVTPGHCYYAITEAEIQFMMARIGFTDTETLFTYMQTLVMLNAIDGELWSSCQGVWCQNLVDNLATMYSKRVNTSMPTKPVHGNGNQVTTTENPVNGADNTQSRVKESKLKERKVVSGGVNEDFANYIQTLKSRYPTLDIEVCWQDCQTWYKDKGKAFSNAKMALNNWCKKELEINPTRKGPKQLPNTETLKEAWDK
jgi:hypothetical protein